MKKLFLILLISLIYSSISFAQGIGDSYTKVIERFTPSSKCEPVKPTVGEVCLDDGTGVKRKTMRKSWEAAIRMNVIDSPSLGDRQFNTSNLDITAYHNLSNTMFAYLTYGNRTIDKDNYEGQVYDTTWSDQHVFAGFGIFLTPNLSVWYGAGRVWAKDGEDEEPSLQTAVDAGIGYDIPMWGNNLRLGYRVVEAKLEGDDIDINEATGDQSYTALSISYRVGLSTE